MIADRISNAYLVEEPEGVYLIDALFSEGARLLLKALGPEEKRKTLKGILLTHQHMDHVGGAARLHWLTGAPVSAHRFDMPAIEHKSPAIGPPLLSQLMRRPAVTVAQRLEHGAMVGPFQVIHVPGHTPGSVAYLHKAKGLLFTGDTLITGKSGRLALTRRTFCYDPEQAALSLSKFEGLKVSAIFPGHGAPVWDQAAEQLSDALARLRKVETPVDHTIFGPEGRPEIHPGMPGWKEG